MSADLLGRYRVDIRVTALDGIPGRRTYGVCREDKHDVLKSSALLQKKHLVQPNTAQDILSNQRSLKKQPQCSSHSSHSAAALGAVSSALCMRMRLKEAASLYSSRLVQGIRVIRTSMVQVGYDDVGAIHVVWMLPT